MGITLFTAAGCARCNIAKNFMRAKAIAFDEQDALGAGKVLFAQFYRAHRGAVVRGAEGIEFPIVVEGELIRQGVAAVIARLQAADRLDGFFAPSGLSKGWVGGIRLSTGDPGEVEDLAAVLGFLKKSGLKLQIETDGRNAVVADRLLRQGIGDRQVMDLKGPRTLYDVLLGRKVEMDEIARSMMLATRFPEFRFETTVAPVPSDAGGLRYMTPEEVADAACWLKEATGSPRQPYFLRRFDSSLLTDEEASALAPLPPEALFRYRSAARRHQVLAEIAK